ncbi:MepB family protein [Rickettsiella endosymbiont of Miltochrista miniata]|uniref:MepB family protein n=1 Tax=Rickettsiella endosymbiont of Miltochrista miniata TaxID=3066239 RepID=UPI00313AA2D4
MQSTQLEQNTNSHDSKIENWQNDALHPDLLATKDLVYSPLHFHYSIPQVEADNAEYGAYFFTLQGRRIKFRVAKITPTKIGQFVTVWKRVGKQPIQPYDVLDPFDLLVISTRRGELFGQFVMPKSVLVQQGILSKAGQGGKRALRVYPPWDQACSRQAQTTQHWQLRYFLEIPHNKPFDRVRAQHLYQQK